MTNNENEDPFMKSLEAITNFEQDDLETLDRYLMVIQYGLNSARQTCQLIKKKKYN